jgi:hypothetical protein
VSLVTAFVILVKMFDAQLFVSFFSTKKVGKVIHSSNYHVDKSDENEKKIKTKMVLGVIPGYSVR